MRVEEVQGQPSWSSGRHGLCLRRGVYPSWGLGHSNEGGGKESRGTGLWDQRVEEAATSVLLQS